jgi:hypothetical protein
MMPTSFCEWRIEKVVPGTKSGKAPAKDFTLYNAPPASGSAEPAIVERCDTLVDGNGNEHRASEFAGWELYWKHGAIHIGQCSEQIARKAAALFVSLWLRGVSASFCDKIMSGMIWFWELQERPSQVKTLNG